MPQIKKYEMLANEHHFSRLYSDVNVLDMNSCWHWTGSKAKDGYGVMIRKINGKAYTIFVHRLSWMTQNGEIPDDMVIDHICHSRDVDNCVGVCKHRSCVNPNHLRVLSIKENMLLSKSKTSAYCKNGHLRTPKNKIARKNGSKIDCLPCRKNYNSKYKRVGA